MVKLRPLFPHLRAYGLATLLVAAATVAFLPGRAYFAKGQWALLYLLIIVLVASLSGVRAAMLASVLSFLCWNYFLLPPYQTFVVSDPKDWLSLFVFLIVGVIMGLQTGKLREREALARAREHETALLNRFSGHLVSELSVEEMGAIVASEVIPSTRAKCAALFIPDGEGKLNEVSFSPAAPCSADSTVVRLVEWAYREAKAVGVPEIRPPGSARPAGWPISVSHSATGLDGRRNDIVIPLQTAARQVGVLYVGERDNGQPYAFAQARLLVAVANQAAAFLERKHLQALAVQADALREADRLRSTFVSGISHELKTPLASITATVTNIVEGDVVWNETAVRGELEAVSKDLDRLNSSIGSLVDLSRLESSAWAPKKDWYELGEIVGTTLAKIPERQRPRISSLLPDDLPLVYVDFVQMSRVLQNLLENALTYSGVSPVRIGASCGAREVKIWVEDEGPGIPPAERERIFEKFYRGSASATMPSGTGLGLAIAAEIVRFHRGRMWVEDVAPHGARMVISLPRES